MFTGIIEAMATVNGVIINGSNKTFRLSSPLAREFKPDQSVSHDGVCLTIESVQGEEYQVTAIEETLKKTGLGSWAPGRPVNLERCMQLNGRLDGHIVQGHTDCTATCVTRTDKNGSYEYTFAFPAKYAHLIIEKGSVCVNGISLTAFNVRKKHFTVAIIPYTFTHTNISTLNPGDTVNLEFDILGKYLDRKLSLKGK